MSVIKKIKSDIIFYNNYRLMKGDFFNNNIENEKLCLKLIIIFLLSKSGRFSLLFRISTAGLFFSSLFRFILNLIYSSDIGNVKNAGYYIYFPHPFSIVIGSDVVLGNNLIIFNSTTIGKSHPGLAGGMPNIGNKVIVSVGSRILGDIKISGNSVIGANSICTKDVEKNSTVLGFNNKKSGNYFS